jgi:hypothetical protein
MHTAAEVQSDGGIVVFDVEVEVDVRIRGLKSGLFPFGSEMVADSILDQLSA